MKRFSRLLVLSLGIGLLAACQYLPPVPRPVSDSGGQTSAARAAERSLSGRVVFPSALKTQVTADYVVRYATVSLIDPSNSRTVVGGRTTASGTFVLMPDDVFNPANGAYYRLEVSRRQGGASSVGQNPVSMATMVKWTDAGGWSSITTPEIVVNATTTAAVLIDAEDGALGFGDLMGKVLGAPAYVTVSLLGGHDVVARAAQVTAKLTSNEDPMGDRAVMGGAGNMHPDDQGDPSKHHDLVLNKNGQASVFVWIPVFTAYQLILPANCGLGNTDKPKGYWVKAKPSLGTEGTDWARETFGGFYVGKYEASRSDATNASAGSGTELKVQQGVVPWTEVNWIDASKACLTYDPHCHLMKDEEWTALAVWSMIEGVQPYGNNNNRKDFDRADITFTDDPTEPGRALTGTGTCSTWVGVTNLTTHTGTTDGVYDLNGNAWEWTGTLGNEGGSYIINGVPVGIALPADGYVTTLSTNPLLRRYGMPETTGGAGVASLGGDHFYGQTSVEMKCVRGGGRGSFGVSGVWAAGLNNVRTNAQAAVGFRPVLAF